MRRVAVPFANIIVHWSTGIACTLAMRQGVCDDILDMHFGYLAEELVCRQKEDCSCVQYAMHYNNNILCPLHPPQTNKAFTHVSHPTHTRLGAKKDEEENRININSKAREQAFMEAHPSSNQRQHRQRRKQKDTCRHMSAAEEKGTRYLLANVSLCVFVCVFLKSIFDCLWTNTRIKRPTGRFSGSEDMAVLTLTHRARKRQKRERMTYAIRVLT